MAEVLCPGICLGDTLFDETIIGQRGIAEILSAEIEIMVNAEAHRFLFPVKGDERAEVLHDIKLIDTDAEGEGQLLAPVRDARFKLDHFGGLSVIIFTVQGKKTLSGKTVQQSLAVLARLIPRIVAAHIVAGLQHQCQHVFTDIAVVSVDVVAADRTMSVFKLLRTEVQESAAAVIGLFLICFNREAESIAVERIIRFDLSDRHPALFTDPLRFREDPLFDPQRFRGTVKIEITVFKILPFERIHVMFARFFLFFFPLEKRGGHVLTVIALARELTVAVHVVVPKDILADMHMIAVAADNDRAAGIGVVLQIHDKTAVEIISAALQDRIVEKILPAHITLFYHYRKCSE